MEVFPLTCMWPETPQIKMFWYLMHLLEPWRWHSWACQTSWGQFPCYRCFPHRRSEGVQSPCSEQCDSCSSSEVEFTGQAKGEYIKASDNRLHGQQWSFQQIWIYLSNYVQGHWVNLIHVVDFWWGVVVLPISNDVYQVVICEVRDGSEKVGEGSEKETRYIMYYAFLVMFVEIYFVWTSM